MLTSLEKHVMDVVFMRSEKHGSCLVSSSEIIALSKSKKLTEKNVEKCMRALELDGYFDFVICDRRGENVYCVNLHKNGYAYKRNRQQNNRNIAFKVVFAVISAGITFLVGKLLVYIFA